MIHPFLIIIGQIILRLSRYTLNANALYKKFFHVGMGGQSNLLEGGNKRRSDGKYDSLLVRAKGISGTSIR